MENTNCNIGQRIYDLRIEQDIQQGELARAIHLHQSVLNRIEKGLRPARDEEIRLIALHFGVSADYLLGLPAPGQSKIPVSANLTPAGQTITNEQEFTLLKKFRALDERGKRAVMDTAERESLYAANNLSKEA